MVILAKTVEVILHATNVETFIIFQFVKRTVTKINIKTQKIKKQKKPMQLIHDQITES